MYSCDEKGDNVRDFTVLSHFEQRMNITVHYWKNTKHYLYDCYQHEYGCEIFALEKKQDITGNKLYKWWILKTIHVLITCLLCQWNIITTKISLNYWYTI